jgi:hypothetical protein
MAASNKWEHNEKNDVYDSNFRNRRMLWYKKSLEN